MYSATLYDTEEKITRTEMVNILLEAKETVFTCTFNKKVTEEDIAEALKTIKSDSDMKMLSKQMT